MYCGSSSFVSDLEIAFKSKNILGCSVKIFGTEYNCSNETYNYSNNSLIFPIKADCLHQTLTKFGLGEPNIHYNKTTNQLLLSEEGLEITLKAC